MIVPGSANPLLLPAETGSYAINNSLRFRSSASAYLSRTPASAGNQTTWTHSCWVKRGALGAAESFFGAGNLSTIGTFIQFTSADQLEIHYYSSAYVWRFITTPVYRDPSAWYNIVLVYDSSNATAGNRMRLYVNGVQVTAFGTSSTITQNQNTSVNNNTFPHYISVSGTYFDGYLAEVNFIDGQALTPSSFGQTDATTGVWQPKAYTGSYGTNGFYLKFADASAATAAAIGKDSSGNGNNWTPTNISVTAGVTYDAMVDSPTNSAAASNYCVMNPLQGKFSTGDVAVTYSNANLQTGPVSTGTANVLGTFGASSGAFYYEVYCNGNSGSGNIIVGVQAESITYATGAGLRNNGTVNGWTVTSGTAPTFTVGDIIGIAFNLSANTFQIYKNGTLSCSGTFTYAANTTAWAQMNGAADSLIWNFGQRPFTYTPPSGFVALNTQNLPTPTIANGAANMAAVLYTGTGASNTITTSSSNSGNNPLGVSFQPDFLWVKSRSLANNNILVNSVIGANSYLVSNATNSEGTNANVVASLNSNGFTLGTDTTLNTNASTGVGWQWKANGAGSSNTSGSITSTVSANVSAGFSVVTYTGTGANATVGHGLGVAPSMIIIKQRTGTARAWQVYHASLGAGGGLYLNQTDAYTADASAFNSTSPTSSVFSLGSSVYPNQSGSAIVAYCFAPVAGYSAFGSYTGNGTGGDGPFCYTGFRPRYLLIKRTDSTSDWSILDSSRDTYNVEQNVLWANLSSAEASAAQVDFLANGFKLRAAAGGGNNISGGTYTYAAFAENPFKYANAR